MKLIPFNRPFLVGTELAYFRQVIQNGHLSGDGPFTRKCHSLIAELLNVPTVLLTTSCTHALEMAALLLDIRAGDEVILPSFTFVSTANAFVLHGARPVFIDIRPDTLNLDESQLQRYISTRTRAIVPVHYAGVACEMDEICRVARCNDLAVIEDNAHGFLGKYRGRFLGTFGALATQSFHETKNISCGEGGALLINHLPYVERAEILREKGTNRNRFFRGQVDKYTWVDKGSSYLPSDLLAALLFAQLEVRNYLQDTRRKLWNTYAHELNSWAIENGVRMPVVPANCQQAHHLFYLLLPSLEERQEFISHLRARGIHAVFHYQPLHLSLMGKKFGGQQGDCPVAESVSNQIVRLPLFYDLTEADQARVIAAVCSFRFRKRGGICGKSNLPTEFRQTA